MIQAAVKGRKKITEKTEKKEKKKYDDDKVLF